MKSAKSFLTLAALSFILSSPLSYAKEITIACGMVGKELEQCKKGTAAWEAKTGHKVNVVPAPSGSNERLTLFQQLLAAESPDIDVFQIDVIWPSLLSSHLIDLSQYIDANTTALYFPRLIENDTVDGRLVALPWFVDAGLLFYRKDLLEKHKKAVPQTWQELTETAEFIQEAERKSGNEKIWGYAFGGKAYEGLTCNGLEWVYSFGGGTIVDLEGQVTINNPKAVAALELVNTWVGRIAPEGVLNYAEEEVRGVFQSGNAVFMRNWPYAWALVNGADSPIAKKVGIAALPKGGEEGNHAATLGGWQLAVSKYSKEPQLAADLVKFLTSKEEQKRRALEAAYHPSITSLYSDPQVLKVNPFFSSLYESFKDAIARPAKQTKVKYSHVSSEFWNAVHSVLSKKQAPEVALKALDRKLLQLSHNGRRW